MQKSINKMMMIRKTDKDVKQPIIQNHSYFQNACLRDIQMVFYPSVHSLKVSLINQPIPVTTGKKPGL
jgi:hypothetical protein